MYYIFYDGNYVSCLILVGKIKNSVEMNGETQGMNREATTAEKVIVQENAC